MQESLESAGEERARVEAELSQARNALHTLQLEVNTTNTCNMHTMSTAAGPTLQQTQAAEP